MADAFADFLQELYPEADPERGRQMSAREAMAKVLANGCGDCPEKRGPALRLYDPLSMQVLTEDDLGGLDDDELGATCERALVLCLNCSAVRKFELEEKT